MTCEARVFLSYRSAYSEGKSVSTHAVTYSPMACYKWCFGRCLCCVKYYFCFFHEYAGNSYIFFTTIVIHSRTLLSTNSWASFQSVPSTVFLSFPHDFLLLSLICSFFFRYSKRRVKSLSNPYSANMQSLDQTLYDP